MSNESWDPKVAAERLADLLVEVLDFAGRVDQGVARGDVYYIFDKATPLMRAAERLKELAGELIDERADLTPHVPLIEAKLQRAGQMGYPLIAKAHPTGSR